jgi:predicted nucleic acid-binding protein
VAAAAAPYDPPQPPTWRQTVVDSSILINFPGLARFDLLFVARRLAITAEVNAEILRNRAPLDAAVARGDVVVHALLLDAAEATQFARLTRRLSIADASTILLAARLGADLAVDDLTFRAEATMLLMQDRLLGTEDMLAEAVRAGALSLADGDCLLGLLPSLRYQPKVASLGELLTSENA